MNEQEESVRKLEARAHGMLPGVAGICMFMLVLTMINAFAALQGKFGDGRGKYGVLVLCTLLAAGVFGLLRLRRWGWALVLGGLSDALRGEFVCISEDTRGAISGAGTVCAGVLSVPCADGSAGPAALGWAHAESTGLRTADNGSSCGAGDGAGLAYGPNVRRMRTSGRSSP